MYLDFYKINKKPFQLSADPHFLWMSEKHKEALAVFKYGLQDNKGFIMLTGDVGIGKTTLINAFINGLDSNVVFANITNPGLKQVEFFNLLGATFNIGSKFSGKDDFIITFRVFLEKCYRDGKQVLLIIDEAQRLGRGIMEEIRLLSNIELQNEKLLNIFFVGQNELNETLDRYENRALRQRMTLLYHLEPLSKSETGEYIQHRLSVAGTEKKIFTPKAAREIYEFSGGYPRIINILCDHAMLTGYVKQKKMLNAPEIIECASELRLKKKSASEPTRQTHKADAGMVSKARPITSRLILNYLPYAAIALFVFFLVCCLYFPLRAGAPFSGIMSYWIDQVRGSDNAASTQPPAPSSTFFKVTEEVTRLGNGGSETPEIENTFEPGGNTAEEIESRGADSSTIQDSSLPIPAEFIPDSEKHYSLAFEFDSDDIAPEGYKRLMKTAALMKEHPGTTLTISGHTDNMGEADYNIMLSKYRADIAKNFLIRQGIAPERITSIGKGAQEPIADNGSYEGRRMNRRVEVELHSF